MIYKLHFISRKFIVSGTFISADNESKIKEIG